MNDFDAVSIGEFTIVRTQDGALQIYRDGGEMMGLNEENQLALESLLEQFWEANF